MTEHTLIDEIDAMLHKREIDQSLYERRLGQTLHVVRESLDEHVSRDQVERILLASEAHPCDVLDALRGLAEAVLTDDPCHRCGDFDCVEDHRPEHVKYPDDEPDDCESDGQTAERCPHCDQPETATGRFDNHDRDCTFA